MSLVISLTLFAIPVAHAIESYAQLSEWFDTYILSASPWENPSAWSDKLHRGKE